MSTLIIYATKHGTTEKCASMLSKKLSGDVDLHNLKKGPAPELAKYDKVVIGGSIYVGKVQKEVLSYCTQNINELKSKKLGLFICCMFKANAETQIDASYPKELLTHAAVKRSFGGEMRFSDMNIAEKLITKMVSKTLAKDDPSLSSIDTKKDASILSLDAIDEFAQQMNIA